MARRHHDGIVVRRERHLAGNIGKAAEDDLARHGIVFFLRKLLAVVVHHYAEAHRRQHRHERAAHMAAAEDIHAARVAQRLDINAVFPHSLGGEIVYLVLRDLLARDNVELVHAVAVKRQQQPEVDVFIEHFAPALEHRDVRSLLRREKLEVNRHRAAADHARAGHFTRVQVVGLELVAATVFERVLRALDAQPLHCAAANRAEHAVIFKDSHLRARAARHRARRRQNAAQHHTLAARKGREHFIKNRFHSFMLLCRESRCYYALHYSKAPRQTQAAAHKSRIDRYFPLNQGRAYLAQLTYCARCA